MQAAEHWLLRLADPESSPKELPEARLNFRGLLELGQMAEWHGVLPNVANRIEHLLSKNPNALFVNAQDAGSILKELAPMRRRVAERAAMALFLGGEARRLQKELIGAGAKIIVLKGMDFAARLYPQNSLRPFVDIDLLTRPKDWEVVSSVMARLNYSEREVKLKHAGGYAERTWENAAMSGAMVEVHDNLVNSPTIRRGVSVRLDDLPLERGAREFFQPTPAGLLVIATVHGAASHSFDKLQHLCDIAQIARGRAGKIDAAELQECAAKTGANFCVALGLDLAARTFDDSACAELLRRLNIPRPGAFTRWLVKPALVVQAQGPRRHAGSWRRQFFRQMLKSRR